MTLEEAIEKFKKIKRGSIFLIHQRIEGKEVIEDYSLCDMAISALQAQDVLDTNVGDTISRQAAIEAVASMLRRKFGIGGDLAEITLAGLPSAQPEPSEITDEQAILHLQSTGWMQNHDREMYESGLRERLADDSGSYDSLIPCEDTISRQAAIDVCNYAIDLWHGQLGEGIVIAVRKKIEELPSAQPEPLVKESRTLVKDLVKDTISRQAAIDAPFKKFDMSTGVTWIPLEYIEQLPSAQPEPCKDAVSRADVVDMLEMFPFTEYSEYETAREVVKRLPSAQPERKKGKWIRITQGAIPEIYMCPFCNRTLKDSSIDGLMQIRYPFCHCGADMRG